MSNWTEQKAGTKKNNKKPSWNFFFTFIIWFHNGIEIRTCKVQIESIVCVSLFTLADHFFDWICDFHARDDISHAISLHIWMAIRHLIVATHLYIHKRKEERRNYDAKYKMNEVTKKKKLMIFCCMCRREE